jgi:hypothetical protein
MKVLTEPKQLEAILQVTNGMLLQGYQLLNPISMIQPKFKALLIKSRKKENQSWKERLKTDKSKLLTLVDRDKILKHYFSKLTNRKLLD